MSRVSVVMPGLDDRELYESALPPLLEEAAREPALAEILVVDDSGGGQLAGWLEERFPEVRCYVMHANSGFAAAALAGAVHAQSELVLLMNPDVRVRPGFLAPLVRAIADRNVFAVGPRVLLFGDPARCESSQALAWEDGHLVSLERADGPNRADERVTAFVVGGALLVRRLELLERGGFDPLFAPFYWEDVDLCLTAWRRGRSVLEVRDSVVEHHHRGTISRCVPNELVHAAIERNRHLLAWKHIDSEAEARMVVQTLLRDVVDAAASDRRADLVHLCLALNELEALARSREQLGLGVRSFADCLRASDPRP